MFTLIPQKAGSDCENKKVGWVGKYTGEYIQWLKWNFQVFSVCAVSIIYLLVYLLVTDGAYYTIETFPTI